MRLYNVLNRVLNSDAKIKTLRLLCRTGGDVNGRQLGQLIKVAPMTAHAALKDLANEGVLHYRRIGRTHIYSLNAEGWVVVDLLKPLFKTEDEYAQLFFQAIVQKICSSGLKKDILSIVVFGSVFRQEERPTSDLDLFIVINDGRQKKAVEDLVFEIDRANLLGSGMPVEPHVNSLLEFQDKYKRGLPLIKDVLKGNKVIYGKKLETLL